MSPADVAWMLAAFAVVLIMFPGIALFYGGMVRAKNVLGMLMQNFFAMGLIGVLWAVVGFSLAFGDAGNGGSVYTAERAGAWCTGSSYTAGRPFHVMKKLMPAITTPMPSRDAAALMSAPRCPRQSAQWWPMPVWLQWSTQSPGSPPKCTREVVFPISRSGPGTTSPSEVTKT